MLRSLVIYNKVPIRLNQTLNVETFRNDSWTALSMEPFEVRNSDGTEKGSAINPNIHRIPGIFRTGTLVQSHSRFWIDVQTLG